MRVKNFFRNPQNYQPLDGFIDLRELQLSLREFVALWKFQRFLHKVEVDRRNGIIHQQQEEIKEFAADYQTLLNQQTTQP